MPKKKPFSKKKRSAPQGAESHQRKQERLEARRRAKEAALIAQHRKERRDKAVRRAAFVVFLVAIVYLVFLRETSPDNIAGNPISSFSTNNGGQNNHTAPYNYTEDTTGTNPPVSGSHDPIPSECGTHSVKIPDENLVHSLEHGTVAILYDPKEVKLPDIKTIESIVFDYEDDVLSAPYPGLPDPIVVASWSRKMTLDELDDEAITEYIDTFRDTEPAPEANQQDCPLDSDDEFEPPEPSPSPSPSPAPSPEASPGDKGGDDKGSGGNGGDDNPTGDDGTADKGSGDGKMDKEEKGN